MDNFFQVSRPTTRNALDQLLQNALKRNKEQKLSTVIGNIENEDTIVYLTDLKDKAYRGGTSIDKDLDGNRKYAVLLDIEKNNDIKRLAAALSHELQHRADRNKLNDEKNALADAQYQKDMAKGMYHSNPEELRARARQVMEEFDREQILYEKKSKLGKIDHIVFNMLQMPMLHNSTLSKLGSDIVDLRNNNLKMYNKFLSILYKFIDNIDEWKQNPDNMGTVSDERTKLLKMAVHRRFS